MTMGGLLRPRRFPLRWVAVAGATVAALAHVPVTGEHLHEAPYMGVLFIALTVTCLGYAAAMTVYDAAAVHLAAALTCSAAVVGYTLTRLIAFPMLADDVGNWLEPLGIVSIVAESIVVAVAVAALRSRAPAHGL